MSTTKWREFPRGVECPVCLHQGRCKSPSGSADSDVIGCFRCKDEEVNGYRRIGQNGEWSTFMRIGAELSPAKDTMADLAVELGVSLASLTALDVQRDGGPWAFPERDATGKVMALNRRFPDGTKRVRKNDKRGLIYARDLTRRPGTTYIVEGPTCTAAGLTMGMKVVGRPAAKIGAANLAELLKGEEEVVVVGDNDQKPNGDWPGLDGAKHIAAELSKAWGKPVPYAMPPEGTKDVRAWLLAHRARDPVEAGRELAAYLQANLVTAPATEGASGLNSHISLISHPEPAKKWPVLDDAAFYGVAGDIVRRIEPHTEADPAALLICFLVAVGNIIGRTAYFTADGARHYLNLFAVLIGETSKGRKGTAWARVMERVVTVVPYWAQERVSGGLSSGEGLIWQVRDPIYSTETEKRDGKKEAVQVIKDPGIDDKRLLCFEAEFASVLRQVDRQGNTLSAVIRKAWESGVLKALTKNSPAHATGAHVSIIGDITVEELLRYLDRTEIAGGFGNRFIWACVRRSKCLPEGGRLHDPDFDGLTPKIAAALEFTRNDIELRRDEKAKALWAQIYPELSEGKPGLAGALCARAEAQVMRLAGVFAVLDCSPLITVEHLTAAVAIWEYCEASVVWCFGDATGDPVADSILTALRGAGGVGLTRTDISGLFGRHVSSERITMALSMLKSRKLVERVIEDGGGGRPPERWFAGT